MNPMVTTLASAITEAASKQTFYTIRFLVDRERVDDAYRAYGYFRWVDDQLDQSLLDVPARMAFVERLKESIPFYSTRHFVKPGITGWAQVCYPYGASDEDALEKLRYDLYYIKNYSIFLDFRIILETIRVVTSGFGGR